MISVSPFEDFEELTGVAQAHELKTARAILRITKDKLNKTRNTLESDPKRSPERLNEDPVYLLGYIGGLKFVLGLQDKAREYIELLKKRKLA